MTDRSAPLAQPPDALKRQTGGLVGTVSSGVRWGGIEQVARMTTMILLTRLIDPRDFGLAALAFLLSHLAPLLGDVGLGAAVVHRPELEERHVATAFTTSLVTGAFLTVTVALTAGSIATFFGEPGLQELLVVMGITFLLRGAMSTPRDLLRRQLRLRPVVQAVTTGVVLAGAAAVAAAAFGAGAWSLVVYAVGENLVALIGICWVARRDGVWQPRLGFDMEALRSLLRFGAPVSGNQVIYYGQTHLDDILVGRFIGAEALGFYGLAYRLMLFPIVKVADVVHSMVFPAFASMQAQAVRFRAAFDRAVQAVALVCFPASIGMAVVAPSLIHVAFGPRWTPAVVTVQILALNGPRLVLGRLGGAAFQALGLPAVELRITAVSFALCAAGFAAGVPFGIDGVAVGYTVAGHLVLPITVVRLARAMQVTPRVLLRPLAPVVGATAAMAAAAVGVQLAMRGLPDGIRLVAAIAAGGLTYAAVLWSTARADVQRAIADLTGRSA